MPLEPLTAVSAVDGRYHDGSSALSDYFSEYALIGARVRVECEYLMALSEADVGMRALSNEERKALRSFSAVSLEDARIVKKLEREGHDNVPATNHDVKAVEYLLKQKMRGTSLEDVSEWTHFALTSEDVNSVAYGLLLSSFVERLLLPALEDVRAILGKLSHEHASTAMLSRTHGQAASPTTFGKEMRVFESRLKRQLHQLSTKTVLVKFGGATGNWNAHMIAAPRTDWLAFAQNFVARLNGSRKIPLELNEVTTQIEPHDHLRGTLRQCEARQRHPDRPRARHLALYLRRLDPPEAKGRGGGFFRDAAQGQPDRFRKRGGQSRRRQRVVRAFLPQASRIETAARFV
jgi:adenylosuccinate lyase